MVPSSGSTTRWVTSVKSTPLPTLSLASTVSSVEVTSSAEDLVGRREHDPVPAGVGHGGVVQGGDRARPPALYDDRDLPEHDVPVIEHLRRQTVLADAEGHRDLPRREAVVRLGRNPAHPDRRREGRLGGSAADDDVLVVGERYARWVEDRDRRVVELLVDQRVAARRAVPAGIGRVGEQPRRRILRHEDGEGEATGVVGGGGAEEAGAAAVVVDAHLSAGLGLAEHLGPDFAGRALGGRAEQRGRARRGAVLDVDERLWRTERRLRAVEGGPGVDLGAAVVRHTDLEVGHPGGGGPAIVEHSAGAGRVGEQLDPRRRFGLRQHPRVVVVGGAGRLDREQGRRRGPLRRRRSPVGPGGHPAVGGGDDGAVIGRASPRAEGPEAGGAEEDG